MIANLLAWSAQTAILVAVATLALWLLRLRSSRARLIVFQCVLFGLIALPFVQPWRGPAIPGSPALMDGAPSLASVQSTALPVAPAVNWDRVLLWVLAGGVLVRGSWLASGMARLRRLRRDAFPVCDVATGEAVAISSDISGPLTFGLRSPAVLVPPEFFDMPDAQRRAVIAHEMLHVHRRDWVQCVAEEVAAALMWFHPAVWYVVAQIRKFREQVVDAAAVRQTGARQEYVEALLSLAPLRPTPDMAAAPLFLRRRDLTERIKAILEEHTMSPGRVMASSACVALTVCAATLYAINAFPLAGAPQSVPARGVLARIDVSRLPEPLRSQVSARVNAYQIGPFTSDLMHRFRSEMTALDPQITQSWVEEVPGVFAVTFSYNTGQRRTEAVLTRIDASRLPYPLRSQVELRLAEFVNAPFDNTVLRRVETAVAAIDRKIACRWSNEPDASLTLNLLYDLPTNGWQPFTGAVMRIDVSGIPEPARSQIEQRLERHSGAPLTNAVMDEISRDVAAIFPRAAIGWRMDPSGTHSVSVTDKATVIAGAHLVEPDFPSGGEKQLRESGSILATRLSRSVPPEYPPLAIQTRVQGTVRFVVQIGKDGRVKAMRLLSGHPLLAQAAQTALQQYVYLPAILDGEPVQVVSVVDVPFTLP